MISLALPRCLVPNNCGIMFEDTKQMRESLWDKYYTIFQIKLGKWIFDASSESLLNIGAERRRKNSFR